VNRGAFILLRILLLNIVPHVKCLILIHWLILKLLRILLLNVVPKIDTLASLYRGILKLLRILLLNVVPKIDTLASLNWGILKLLRILLLRPYRVQLHGIKRIIKIRWAKHPVAKVRPHRIIRAIQRHKIDALANQIFFQFCVLSKFLF
jgi:hypothetical protein